MSVHREVRRGQTKFGKRSGQRASYRIQYYDQSHKRRSIRMPSGTTRREAEQVDLWVKRLASAAKTGEPIDDQTRSWLTTVGPDITERLVRHNLIAPRKRSPIDSFIAGYIAGRSDARPNTIRNWNNSRAKLVDFFGEKRDLRTITVGDADNWRQSLVDKGLSSSTISKAVKHAKQFLKQAVRQGYCEENPFADLVAGGERNEERKSYVPDEVILKVMEECPNAEWRLIIALCRFGGLRCPSEVLSLRWRDIDWANNRFTVTATKTKSSRVPPIFPRLHPYLQEGYEAAPTGAEFVITRYRGQGVNLRTQFERMIRRAGFAPWPRLFHNLRASCQNQLEEDGNRTYAVCQWLGNSESVAKDHYRKVTDADYDRALSAKGCGETGVQLGVQEVGDLNGISGNVSDQMEKSQGLTADAAFSSGLPKPYEYPLGESNPCCRTENPES